MMETNKIYNEDCIAGLRKLPDNSVDCCVTSPPYYGLRDYGTEGQIGLEETPDMFVQKLVEVFREVKRVLKDDGTLWLNLGDSYNGNKVGNTNGTYANGVINPGKAYATTDTFKKKAVDGLKPKDLIGIPWMVAFALRADGWYLRQDIIWSKPSCMPESVRDRCTKSHEYIFLLSKSSKYYYDYESIQEDAVWDVDGNGTLKRKLRQNDDNKNQPNDKINGIRKVYSDVKTGTAIKAVNGKRNKRSVWAVNPAQFPEAHFATFPEDLIVDCIKAGSSEHGCCDKCGKPYQRQVDKEIIWRERPNQYTSYQDVNGQPDQRKEGVTTSTTGWLSTCDCNAGLTPAIILDPFMGAGTTGLVARKLNRNYIGFELNMEYIKIAERRIATEIGLFV